MAGRKLTRDEEGNTVSFSTKRNDPTMCNTHCPGAYSFKGELYCKHFHSIVGRRHRLCMKNEIEGGKA